MAAVGEEPRRPGVLDLYRALHASGRDLAERYHLAIAIEIGLVVLYVALRSADAPRTLLVGWTLLLAVTALAAPVSALVVLVAVVPFTEWLLVDRDTGMKILVIPLIGLGVLLRGLAAGRIPAATAGAAGTVGRLGILTALLWAGSALAVVRTFTRFDADIGERALFTWLAGVGGGLVVFSVSVVAARAGSRRLLYVACGSIVVAAAASLLEHVVPGTVRSAPLDWLLRPARDDVRLTGIIPAPNAVAAVFGAGLAVLLAVLAFGHDRRRWLLAPVAAMLLVAIILTFSRSGILALGVLAVLLAWHASPRRGRRVLLGIAVVAVVGVPLYLQARAATVGAGAALLDGSLLTPSDLERLGAWAASVRMWLDEPLLGVGFLGFRELHDAYGSPAISAPHNELLRLLAEGGIGLALVGAGWVAAVVLRMRGRPGWLPVAGLGALAVLIVAGAYNNPFLYVQVLGVILPIVGVAVGWRDAQEPASAAGSVPEAPPGGHPADSGAVAASA